MINIIKKIIQFIFPNRCVVCDQVLSYGDKLVNTHLCENCKNKLEFIDGYKCKKCGAKISNEFDMFCKRCKDKMYDSFVYGFGLCRYNDAVKQSIHRIKYSGRKEYIDFYGKSLAKMYKKDFISINADCLIPVPIHKKRMIKRNYNQAEILARSISQELKKYDIDLPVRTDIIYRSKNTKVLNKLDALSRDNELKDAFLVKSFKNINKAIVVDDIYTTGSTIDHICKILKKSGIKELYFCTITVLDNI